MRFRTLALPILVSLVAGPAVAAVPDAVPDLPVLGQQAPRGAGLITSYAGSVAPTPKTVDGKIDDWVGDITRYAGTAIYSGGEYVYQDYLMDGWGADAGGDQARAEITDTLNGIEPRTYRTEALAQALGEQFGADCDETVCAVAHYGNVEDRKLRGEADIEEVRVAADDENLYFLVRTNGMTTPDKTGVLLLLNTGSYLNRECVPAPCETVAGIETGYSWLLAAGSRAVAGEGVNLAAVTVATDPSRYDNAVEIGVPLSALAGEFAGAGLATCFMDEGGSACKKVRQGDARGDLLNVAFRFDEPQRIWMDHDQAFALHDGSIDRYLTLIDLSKLRGGFTESFQPRPGYWERIYVSDSPVNVESESNAYFQGQFQHYGVYLPSNFRPGAPLPTTWWTHYRGGHAHDAAAWLPGLLRQFGEQKDNIMIFPSARGTSSWYVGRGHEDFLEVWDDAMANLPIDGNRVYMTGYSMGGFASWFLPMVYPDRFAGASPQEGPPAIGLFVGTGGSSDPSSGQNGNDPQATHTYNIVENARNVPYAVYHGTDDELVPISGVVAMQKRFIELGYQQRLYALDGNEHYTTAVVDMWTEAADYLNRFRRDPNPARVTYRTWPALEYAASTSATNTGVNLHYRFNKAYWVSDLTVRGVTYPIDAKPNASVWGTIDAESFGRGADVNLLVPEAGSGHQGTPYEMTGTRWIRNGSIAPSNSFRATLTNLSTATFDVGRMGLSTSQELSGSLFTDGPTTLKLTGSWGAAPFVGNHGDEYHEVTSSYASGVLTVQLPEAGRYSIGIRA